MKLNYRLDKYLPKEIEEENNVEKNIINAKTGLSKQSVLNGSLAAIGQAMSQAAQMAPPPQNKGFGRST